MLIYVSVRAYLFGQGEQGAHGLGVGGQVGICEQPVCLEDGGVHFAPPILPK